jgi:hypothetical protein
MWIRDIATAEGTADDGGASSTSIPFTVEDADDVLVVAVGATKDTLAASTPVVWDATSPQTLTEIISETVAGNREGAIYAINDPTPESTNVVVSWAASAAGKRYTIAVYALRGASATADDTVDENHDNASEDPIDLKVNLTSSAAEQIAFHAFGMANRSGFVSELDGYEDTLDVFHESGDDYHARGCGHKLFPTATTDDIGALMGVVSGTAGGRTNHVAAIFDADPGDPYPSNTTAFNDYRDVRLTSGFDPSDPNADDSYLRDDEEYDGDFDPPSGTWASSEDGDNTIWKWTHNYTGRVAGSKVIVLALHSGDPAASYSDDYFTCDVGDGDVNEEGSASLGSGGGAFRAKLWIEDLPATSGSIVIGHPDYGLENPSHVPDTPMQIRIWFMDGQHDGVEDFTKEEIGAARGHDQNPTLTTTGSDYGLAVTIAAGRVGTGSAADAEWETFLGDGESEQEAFSGMVLSLASGTATEADDYTWAGQWSEELSQSVAFGFILTGDENGNGNGNGNGDSSANWMRNRFRRVGDQTRSGAGLLGRPS